MALFTGVRNFIAALRVQLDNAVNWFLDTHGIQLGAAEHVVSKAPNLPLSEAQQVVDFTVRSREFGERINRLSPETRLATGRAPVNPAYSGPPVYWAEVNIRDARSGVVYRRLAVLNVAPTETRRQAEQRARSVAQQNWEDSPGRIEKQKETEGEEGAVTWLRGFIGI